MYIIYVKFTIWIRVGKEMEEELNLFFGFLENDKKVSNNTLQSYERDLKQYERYLREQGKEYKEETNEGIK